MGLDQYLYARKFVAANDYSNKNGEFITTPNPEFDQIASAVGLDREDLALDTPSVHLDFKVAYWRKANQVHNWFVREIQDGNDDCKEYYVTREDLQALRDICFEIHQTQSKDVAYDLLPTTSGSFYGNQEYDEDYFWQIKNTIKQLEKILDNPRFLDYDFTYTSSW